MNRQGYSQQDEAHMHMTHMFVGLRRCSGQLFRTCIGNSIVVHICNGVWTDKWGGGGGGGALTVEAGHGNAAVLGLRCNMTAPVTTEQCTRANDVTVGTCADCQRLCEHNRLQIFTPPTN